MRISNAQRRERLRAAILRNLRQAMRCPTHGHLNKITGVSIDTLLLLPEENEEDDFFSFSDHDVAIVTTDLIRTGQAAIATDQGGLYLVARRNP